MYPLPPQSPPSQTQADEDQSCHDWPNDGAHIRPFVPQRHTWIQNARRRCASRPCPVSRTDSQSRRVSRGTTSFFAGRRGKEGQGSRRRTWQWQHTSNQARSHSEARPSGSRCPSSKGGRRESSTSSTTCGAVAEGGESKGIVGRAQAGGTSVDERSVGGERVSRGEVGGLQGKVPVSDWNTLEGAGMRYKP